MKRQLEIDSAPGKSLLEPILSGDVNAFAEFYKKRRDWFRYPLVHDRLVTYGIYHDLISSIPRSTKAALLPEALSLAEAESDRFLLCAIFLIRNLLSGYSESSNQKEIQLRLRDLHPRVQKLSLFRNMSCFWNQIASKVFTAEGEYGDLVVHAEDWRKFVSLDLPYVDDDGWKNCPGGESLVKEKVEGISGGDFILEFKRSVLFNDLKVWVWLYRNQAENPIHHFYVYIVMKANGKSRAFRKAMHSVIRMSPEELVVKYAHGVL